MEEKRKRASHAAIGSAENDCFGVLPDEILVVILSGLELKEAARTCVLSQRWRNLWRKSSVSLDFDTKDTMLRLVQNYGKTRPDEALKYMDLVNQVMETHEGPTLEQLRIVFDIQGCENFIKSSIDKWVDYAIVKRVQRLELDLNSIYGSLDSSSTYIFPSWLLDIPLDLPSFDRLTALCLKSVSVSDADIEYFLSTCLFLEQLIVENASSLQNVSVSGEALKLNHLEIRYCYQLENLEISAINLESFKYTGPTRALCFGNVQKLSSISIGNEYCELDISLYHRHLYLSRLEKLELDLKHMTHDRCIRFPSEFMEFSNLQVLELQFIAAEDECLLFLSSILRASPCLQKLTLKYKMDDANVQRGPGAPEQPWEELGGRFVHQCLRVIEFVGWIGSKNYVQLANYLIERAVSLETVILDFRIPHFLELSWTGEFYPNKGDKEDALPSALQLQEKLPLGAKLELIWL